MQMMKTVTDTGVKSSDGLKVGGRKNPAILKNEIILKRERKLHGRH